MTCVKPGQHLVDNGELAWYCYLYDAKFGGRSDQFIEAVSMQSRYDEDCAYKNDKHEHHDKCRAEPSAIDAIPYFSRFV